MPSSFPTCLLGIFLFLLLSQSLNSHSLSHKTNPLTRPTSPSSLPLFHLHTVDDIGPAFSNATAAGLSKARKILTNYADILRIISIPTGLLTTFFGYFLLSPVLFISAFISGGGACFIAVSAILGSLTPATAWISIAAMFLGGALLGFLAIRMLSVGMFAVGAALGFVLASAVKASLISRAYPEDPELAFKVVAAVCGTLFGMLGVCLQKQMLIFSTAYAGSAGCLFGIGHFAGHFPSEVDLEKMEDGQVDAWFVGYIVAMIVLGTIGLLFQFWLSKGKGMPSTRRQRHRRRGRRRLPEFDSGDLTSDEDWPEQVYAERGALRTGKTEIVVCSSGFGEGEEVVRKVTSGEADRRESYSSNSWNCMRNTNMGLEGSGSQQEQGRGFQVEHNVGGGDERCVENEGEEVRGVVERSMEGKKEEEVKAGKLEGGFVPGMEIWNDEECDGVVEGMREREEKDGGRRLVDVSLESDVEYSGGQKEWGS